MRPEKPRISRGAVAGTTFAILTDMNAIVDRLRADHEQLEELLLALAEATDAPDWDALEASWDALEARLLGHMEAEERGVLPLLDASHPAEVQHLLTEHAQLRGRIFELGIAIELHLARKPEVLALIDELRRHASEKDESIYRLAGDRESSAVGRGLLSSLERALLLRSAPPPGERQTAAPLDR